MDARALLAALQDAGIPAKGLTILDVADSSTWTFDGALNKEQIAAAIVIVRSLLNPLPKTPQLSKLAFLLLLDPKEYAAFIAGTQTDSMLCYAKALLDAALTLSPTQPTFQSMLAYCTSVGIFTPDRAAAVVAAMGTL